LWDVIPSGWQTALLLGAVVVALALVAYGRRFGPPYDLARRLPPGRETYLESVAGILSRAGAVSDSLEVLREEALRLLSERGDPRAAAVAAGLEDAEIEALFADDVSEESLVSVDRALAKPSREKARRESCETGYTPPRKPSSAARPPPSTPCSSPRSSAAMCSSKGSRGPPRRCWPGPSPRPWACRSPVPSSPPTCCPRT